MKKIKQLKNKIFGILLVLMLITWQIPAVHAAGTAQLSITGQSTASVGDTFSLTIRLGTLSDNGKVAAVGGVLSTSDSSVIQVVLKSNGKPDCTASADTETMGYSGGQNNKISFLDSSGDFMTGQNTNIGTCKFKAVANGTATITLTGSSVIATDNSSYVVNMSGKTITVGAVTSSSTTQSTTQSTTKSTTKSTATSATGAASTNSTGGSSTKSPNANLASLGVSGYTLSPSFSAGTITYTVTVPSTATTATITASAADSKATVSGTGSVSLNGTTTSESKIVTVTAEDGTKKTYTINFVKSTPSAAKDSDSSLKDLTVDGKTITGFSKTKTNYTLNVDKDTTSISLAGVANSSKSTVTVSGGTNLKAGTNVATVTVTAEDGSKTVYTINIVKPSTTTTTTKKGATTTSKKSSETGIGTFVIGSSHTMEPEKYSDSVDVYDITVPYSVESLDLSLVLKNSKAKYEITGNENFQVGKVNVVTIKITAEDGTVRNVILNVTRSTDIDGTQLTGFDPGDGATLTPTFDPDTLDYVVELDGDKDKLDLKYDAPEGSTVKVYGNSDLKEGWNTVLVSVQDENGYTRTYSFKVYKNAKKLFGLTYTQFGILAGIIGGLILTFLLILLLLARRRKKEDKAPVEQAPVIDFKPEFNFGSRNGTDDDVVYPNAVLNQDSKVQKDVQVDNADEDVLSALNPTIEHRNTNTNENYSNGYLPPEPKERTREIEYDPYDEVVTKDELIDAIEEGLETKNPEKLKMLLEQEELNRKKEALREKEKSRRSE